MGPGWSLLLSRALWECSESIVPLLAEGLWCGHTCTCCLGGVGYRGRLCVSFMQTWSSFFRGNTEHGSEGCMDSKHFLPIGINCHSRNLALPPSFTWVCLICLRLCAFSLDTWTLQHLEKYRTDVKPAWASWTIITETLVFGHPYWLWALVEPIRRKARQGSSPVLMHRMMMDPWNGWG